MKAVTTKIEKREREREVMKEEDVTVDRLGLGLVGGGGRVMVSGERGERGREK